MWSCFAQADVFWALYNQCFSECCENTTGDSGGNQTHNLLLTISEVWTFPAMSLLMVTALLESSKFQYWISLLVFLNKSENMSCRSAVIILEIFWCKCSENLKLTVLQLTDCSLNVYSSCDISRHLFLDWSNWKCWKYALNVWNIQCKLTLPLGLSLTNPEKWQL